MNKFDTLSIQKLSVNPRGSGSTRVAYRKLGSGPDVVFVHGWPLSSATFRDIATTLAQKFTCHLFDLPGAGSSDWDDHSPIDIASHAASLRTAIDQLNIQRYALVAHDSGATIARILAAEDRERVTGIVMGNTEIPNYHPSGLTLMTYLSKLPGSVAAVRALAGSKRLRRSNLGFGSCFHDRDTIEGEFYRYVIAPMLEDRRVIEGQLRFVHGFTWDVVDALTITHQRIAAPVQMIWGANDPWFPLGQAQQMVDQFPGGASLEIIRPGKLFVHEEEHQRFCDFAMPFLTQCSATHVRKAS